MNTVDIGDVKHEIVIVRRSYGDGEEAHHGGVWKIAFADFMTAMMCFFLVMWLISVADEHTKAAVANYFNPVQLVDKNSSRKNLEDVSDTNAIGRAPEGPQPANAGAGSEGKGTSGPSTEQDSSASPDAVNRSDEHLFADPYAVLAEIAANSGVRQNVSDKGDGGAQESGPATGASGGESYRDPFAPDFWSQQVATPLAEASAERAKVEAEAKSTENNEIRPVESSDATPPLSGDLKAPEDTSPLQELAKAENAARLDAQAKADETAPAPTNDKPTPAAEQAAQKLTKELNAAFPPSDKLYEGISVKATSDGVTISITDQLDFGMFEIGSAVPRRELVLAMEKIGKALSGRPGSVTISGHTDARPFRSQNYDNWRLSTARAHSAYYMLVRGGLDEHRVTEVSGYADRKLKDTSQPLSAVNRRIEIHLELPQ
ncbi:MotB family protein [Pseudaminobacter soli (ex Li et al. 2025)]|uniref:MotB family protein n=1 Tax=Pseudaminobacter soli (ex Li et al. 2025) TaxID=1295366 RepID=UPI001FE0024D|nr:MotB family protein [Mesorhizobium soli]